MAAEYTAGRFTARRYEPRDGDIIEITGDAITHMRIRGDEIMDVLYILQRAAKDRVEQQQQSRRSDRHYRRQERNRRKPA